MNHSINLCIQLYVILAIVRRYQSISKNACTVLFSPLLATRRVFVSSGLHHHFRKSSLAQLSRYLVRYISSLYLERRKGMPLKMNFCHLDSSSAISSSFFIHWKFTVFNPLPPSDAVSKQKIILEELFSVVLI